MGRPGRRVRFLELFRLEARSWGPLDTAIPTRAPQGPEPGPFPLGRRRAGAARERNRKGGTERERKGKGREGRGRGKGRDGEGERRERRRERPGKARRRPAAPRPPPPRPGLTFQVAAGGRGEPLLGLAAHQLQADLQHLRVRSREGRRPLPLRGAAQVRLVPLAPCAPPGPRGPAMRPPRRPARPPVAAAGSRSPRRTRLLTKGPSPAREARPRLLTALTPSAPRRDPLQGRPRPSPRPKPIPLLNQQHFLHAERLRTCDPNTPRKEQLHQPLCGDRRCSEPLGKP